MHPILFCDLDGTLLPHVYNDGEGKLRTPTFKEGPVFQHILRWLQLGGRLVGVTGSSLSTHVARFWDDIPMQLRVERKVMLSCETGASLHHQDANGNLVEDVQYFQHNFPTGCGFSEEETQHIIQIGQVGLSEFYADLKDKPTLIEDDQLIHLHKKARDSPLSIPVSSDVNIVPRIEVRGAAQSIVFVGIPVALCKPYFEDRLARLGYPMEGKPAGRLVRTRLL